MRHQKKYAKTRCKKTGRLLLVHRQVAAEMLGRPLLPGEIVHHRDGDSANNDPSNLIVLPSQSYHAHMEYHLRLEKRGMPSLFPELFEHLSNDHRGTLFEHLVC